MERKGEGVVGTVSRPIPVFRNFSRDVDGVVSAPSLSFLFPRPRHSFGFADSLAFWLFPMGRSVTRHSTVRSFGRGTFLFYFSVLLPHSLSFRLDEREGRTVVVLGDVFLFSVCVCERVLCAAFFCVREAFSPHLTQSATTEGRSRHHKEVTDNAKVDCFVFPHVGARSLRTALFPPPFFFASPTRAWSHAPASNTCESAT